jgi:hypothetical protein
VRHVEDAVVAGTIADADPLVVAHAILGVTNQLARAFVLTRGDDWEAVADGAIAFCLGGLAGALPAIGSSGTGMGAAAPPAPARTPRVLVG